MGVGSTGPFLAPYESSDTFLSTDAGKTWTQIASGPHKFESVGSGAILLLVPDSGLTDVIKYSLDLGASWSTLSVPLNGHKWAPRLTILDTESRSLKALVLVTGEGMQSNFMVQIDFSLIWGRKCEIDEAHPESSADFSGWSLKNMHGTCFLGQDLGLLLLIQCFIVKRRVLHVMLGHDRPRKALLVNAQGKTMNGTCALT